MFTGREFDADTGLYYYRARYYNPEIGRFLQTDPSGYGDGLNLYAYVGNSPINLVDPLGLCKENPFSWWDNLKTTVGNAVGDAIGWWYEQSGGEEMEEYYWEGRHVGTEYGESAQKWWAERYVKAETWYEKAGYWLGGVAASAWTPETWKATAGSIAVMGSAAGPASNSKPWLGRVAAHGAHHGSGPHLEVIVRVGGHKVLKIFIPGARTVINWVIH